MVRSQVVSTFAIILSFCFILLALPDKGFSGVGPVPIACCQGEGDCTDSSEGPFMCISDNFVEDAFCDQETGLCTSIARFDSVPTLSEWGLIAMAGILCVAGYIVIRRRKVTA